MEINGRLQELLSKLSGFGDGWDEGGERRIISIPRFLFVNGSGAIT